LEAVSVCVDDRIIVRDVSLNINPAELHVIMGPNGVGKSTLLAAIMGLSHVQVCGGRILFNGVDITRLPSYERAKLGISLAHQVTPTFRGVRFLEVAKAISSRFNTDWRSLASLLRVEGLLLRDLFHGFSGGERRRAELYLALLQNPKLLLLDEPDSGVDVDTLEGSSGTYRGCCVQPGGLSYPGNTFWSYRREDVQGYKGSRYGRWIHSLQW
jgi:Fe-S cluster assembly ATP-binding protein